jgi:hypothetical protein
LNNQKKKSLFRKVRTLFIGDTEFDFSKPDEKSKEGKPEIIHVAGRQIISREEAEACAAKYLGEKQCINWGGIRIPEKTHFLYVGQNRSGKSLLIKQLMAQVFSRFGKGTNQRAVIYDASTELISFLYGLIGGRVPIYILDPEDARCTAWKMSEDIRTKDEALNLGQYIFPKGNEHSSKDEYFTEGPSTVMAGVINAFLLNNEERKERREDPIDWTLRDVRLALSNVEDAKELLGKRPETREVIKYFESSNADLDRTVINKFDRLESTAARWHYSTIEKPGKKGREPISLREFFNSKDSAIIVIGGSSDVTVKAVNHVIFEQMAALMLDKSVPSETDSRTWLYLDEFSDIGKMEIMGKLLSMGLKKGVRVVAAYQNIASVAKVYGEYDPSIIKSEIQTIAFLMQQGDTAKNASAFIGEREILRRKVSKGTGQTITTDIQINTNETEEYVPDKVPVLSQHNLEQLPVAGAGVGVGGYFLTHFVQDIFHHHIRWDELEHLANLKSEEPNFVPNVKEAERLRQWRPEEKRRLGVLNDSQAPPQTDLKDPPTETAKSNPVIADKILDALIKARVRKSE